MGFTYIKYTLVESIHRANSLLLGNIEIEELENSKYGEDLNGIA